MGHDHDYKEEMARFGEAFPGMYDTSGGIIDQQQTWDSMPSKYEISKADLKTLNDLSAMPIDLSEKFAILNKTETLALIIRLFKNYDSSDASAVADRMAWLAVLMHEVLRDDGFRHGKLLHHIETPSDLHSALLHALKKQSKPHIADRIVALATGFIAHDAKYRNATDVEELTVLMIDRKTKCTNAGVLAAIGNLLKVAKFRAHLWNISGVHVLIRASLSPTKSDPVSQYQATLCTWLLSFTPKFIPHIVESGILVKLLQLMKQAPRKEKIVRLTVEVVFNALTCLDAIQIMLEEKLSDTLDLLLFEKWRSEDLYSRIEEVNSLYVKKVREWSTFDRYTKELDSGRLTYGYLHEEQFWADNVMEFEQNEFLPIRKLITLLRSSDPVTLAVACHDLGEFARLHPVGKKVLGKLHARDMLLALMNHQDRDVERESLLSIQKLMLDNWEVATK